MNPAALPHFGRFLPALSAGRPEQDFERALDLMITGLIAAAPTSPAGRWD